MPKFNSQIDKLTNTYSEITKKYGTENGKFGDYFISKIYICYNNLSSLCSYYGDGKLYDAYETDMFLEDDDEEIDSEKVLMHIRFDMETQGYVNLLPDGPCSVYADVPEVTETYDEVGNRIENFGDKLFLKYDCNGNYIARKYWNEKTRSWINQYFFEERRIKKMMMADDDNNLILLLLSKYFDGNETERFIFDAGLQFVLKTVQEFDEDNNRLSSVHYLPDGSMAWRTSQCRTFVREKVFETNFIFDKNDKLVHKDLEIIDDKLGSITLFLLHSSYLDRWNEGLDNDEPLLLGDMVNLACFGEEKSRWIDPYPEYG